MTIASSRTVPWIVAATILFAGAFQWLGCSDSSNPRAQAASGEAGGEAGQGETGDRGNDDAAAAAGTGEDDPGARGLDPLPVSGVVAQRGPFVLTIRGTGRTEAIRRALLSSRVGERVERVRVRAGDRVERGQTLLELETAPFEWALRDAEADLSRATLDYDAQLFADTAATDQKKLRVAHRTGLTRAQQAVERARLDMEGARLLAPFGGWIAGVEVSEGERVRPDQGLITLVDLSNVRIPAEVLESRFGALQRGARVQVRFPALPGEVFDGTVAALGPEVDPERGTGLAYVELANPEGRVRPGMYAEVAIEAAAHENRLSVPRAAVLERNRRLLVFVARHGRAEWSYVETGMETDDSIELTSGVAHGDTVLTSGHLTLAHGAPVRVSLERP